MIPIETTAGCREYKRKRFTAGPSVCVTHQIYLRENICIGRYSLMMESIDIFNLFYHFRLFYPINQRIGYYSSKSRDTNNCCNDTSSHQALPQRPSLRLSLRSGAAVDDEAGAGHEAGIVRREKDNAFSNIGDRTQAANREPLQ
jgi:hypothetical protein